MNRHLRLLTLRRSAQRFSTAQNITEDRRTEVEEPPSRFFDGFETGLIDAERLKIDPEDIYYDYHDMSWEEKGWIQAMIRSGMRDWFYDSWKIEDPEYYDVNTFIAPIKIKPKGE